MKTEICSLAYALDLRKDKPEVNVLTITRSSGILDENERYLDEGEEIFYDFIIDLNHEKKDMSSVKFDQVIKLTKWAIENLKQL